MPYQGKEDPGSAASSWNQMMNTLVLWAPALFGCSRVTLKDVVTAKSFENLSAILQKLGAVKVAEGGDSAGKCHRHYFRVQRRPIILILEEPHPVQVIAPGPIIEYIENEMKIVLS